MNLSDVISLLFTLNWSDIVNILLTIILIVITYYQVIQANRQTTLSKLHRIDNEFKEVVEPLYSQIESPYYFRDRPPSYRIDQAHRHYWSFWEGVEYNKYLCPKYLRDEIEAFLKMKSDSLNGFDEIEDTSEKAKVQTEFHKVKKQLFDAVKRRYADLHKEKEELLSDNIGDYGVRI